MTGPLCEHLGCEAEAKYRREAAGGRAFAIDWGDVSPGRAFVFACEAHAPQGKARTKWNTVPIEEGST